VVVGKCASFSPDYMIPSAETFICTTFPKAFTIITAVARRILLATQPVDFRKGAHGLAALAQEVLVEDPFSSTVIVYRSKRSERWQSLYRHDRRTPHC
jgi:hypothetical protein